jgi:hypothetical protein
LVVTIINSIYFGYYALRDESCQEFFEDHHREERYYKSETRLAKEGNSKASMAHCKSHERAINVETSSAIRTIGC